MIHCGRSQEYAANVGFAFPLQRLTVNLAPAEVRKDGAGYDLPYATTLPHCRSAGLAATR